MEEVRKQIQNHKLQKDSQVSDLDHHPGLPKTESLSRRRDLGIGRSSQEPPLLSEAELEQEHLDDHNDTFAPQYT